MTRTRAMSCVLLGALALLAGCEGTHDLARRGCLPLQVPAQVVLAQEAGLYAVRDEKLAILAGHPRDTRNDAFHGMRLLRTLPPGTRLAIDGLEQAWASTSGQGGISALGTLPGGERFAYGWGTGTTIGRAPWEPASVPRLRTVACGD